MINRTIQPELVSIKSVDFVEPKKYEIGKGVYLYHMKDVPNETSRFDLYFNAGKARKTKGISSFVNGLLLSGTSTKSTIEINDEINGLGGFYEAGVAMESGVVSMFCLRENLLSIFNTIHDSIKNLAFIEKEVEQFFSNRKQQFKISMEKVSVLAQREFQQNLFGSNENYRAISNEEDLDNVSIDELREFHEENYLNGLNKVVIVGDIDDETIHKIIALSKEFLIDQDEEFAESLSNISGRSDVPKEKAMQSAIRVGRTLFNKNHDDYLDFLILNTILGDYFGSRLMSNIREDKGYTYGIGTVLAEFRHTGYFLVATEVGVDVKEDTLKEIKYEFERLQNELVPTEELDLVRNYMLGQLLKSADGPYAMTDLFLSAETQGKELDFYNLALKRINDITSIEIQTIAKKYLNWDEMTIVTAG